MTDKFTDYAEQSLKIHYVDSSGNINEGTLATVEDLSTYVDNISLVSQNEQATLKNYSENLQEQIKNNLLTLDPHINKELAIYPDSKAGTYSTKLIAVPREDALPVDISLPTESGELDLVNTAIQREKALNTKLTAEYTNAISVASASLRTEIKQDTLANVPKASSVTEGIIKTTSVVIEDDSVIPTSLAVANKLNSVNALTNSLQHQVNQIVSQDSPDASLDVKGIVQLTNTADSENETKAITPKGVQQAIDNVRINLQNQINEVVIQGSPNGTLDIRGTVILTNDISDDETKAVTPKGVLTAVSQIDSLKLKTSTDELTVALDSNKTLSPKTTDEYNLGSTSKCFNNAYINKVYGTLEGKANSAIHADDAVKLADINGQQKAVTDANRPIVGDSSVTVFKVNSTTTSNKPPHDATVLNFEWTSDDGYTAQLAIANSTGQLYVRGMNKGTWTDWQTIPFLSDVATSSKNGFMSAADKAKLDRITID